jgi:hypothetical protein
MVALFYAILRGSLAANRAGPSGLIAIVEGHVTLKPLGIDLNQFAGFGAHTCITVVTHAAIVSDRHFAWADFLCRDAARLPAMFNLRQRGNRSAKAQRAGLHAVAPNWL